MENKMELNQEDLDSVSGGSIFEADIGWSWKAKYADYYRLGICQTKGTFTADVYSIASPNGRIYLAKDTAETILKDGTNLWRSSYRESGDLVGFWREWKGILKNKYGIEWDGSIGGRSTKA